MAQTAAVMGLSTTGPQDQYIFDEKIGVYVINCDDHKDRLNKFKKYAKKFN